MASADACERSDDGDNEKNIHADRLLGSTLADDCNRVPLETLVERIKTHPRHFFDDDLLGAWAEDALIIGPDDPLTPDALNETVSVYRCFWSTLARIQRRAPELFSSASWPPTPASTFWLSPNPPPTRGDIDGPCCRGAHVVYARRLDLAPTATTASIQKDALIVAETEAVEAIISLPHPPWPTAVDPILSSDSPGDESAFLLVCDSGDDDRRCTFLFARALSVFSITQDLSIDCHWLYCYNRGGAHDVLSGLRDAAAVNDTTPATDDIALWLHQKVCALLDRGATCLLGLDRLGRRCDLPPSVLRLLPRTFRGTGIAAVYYGAFFQLRDLFRLVALPALPHLLAPRRDTLEKATAAFIAGWHPDPAGPLVASAITPEMHRLVGAYMLLDTAADLTGQTDRLHGIARLFGLDPAHPLYAGNSSRLCAAVMLCVDL
ncbi:hypothetical protein pneo_cds_982 [Pandoravirus neocaledonia]|uniref:DUF5848 domain-containing protein n=1 Tax=Pandoravirus neocaledonia TaxID=2107708 RepID=A0A2U7UDP0_9VIRU|nr:hypothetical protein pneo_cds_982 [Pandoravirus neocaledonia]AVK76589.1 hypothetical protein pneo_cds_982 [Pandoravirus neocaledonia]